MDRNSQAVHVAQELRLDFGRAWCSSPVHSDPAEGLGPWRRGFDNLSPSGFEAVNREVISGQIRTFPQRR
jgi:hypothetical protein